MPVWWARAGPCPSTAPSSSTKRSRASARAIPAARRKLIVFDPAQAMLAMEHLTPHKVARRAFMEGEELPLLGTHLGLYLARTLFRGSDWSMPTTARKADLALFAGNAELAGITEELVFSDPFKAAPLNRHTPGLDDIASRLPRRPRALKLAAVEMKARFATCAEDSAAWRPAHRIGDGDRPPTRG